MSRYRILLRDAPPPTVAVEFAVGRVSAAALDTRAGRPVVAMHAAVALPPGALVPSLVAQNIPGPGRSAVAAALAHVLDEMGRPRRIGLVLPDPVAKVSLVRFEHLPSRAEDLDQMVRWQVRKAAPFPLDEAQVSYIAGATGPAAGEAGNGGMQGHEFIVSVARRAVI